MTQRLVLRIESKEPLTDHKNLKNYMHTLNIIVKNSPLPISIQRKEAADGERVYQQITAAMSTANPAVLELTCEKQEGKKVAIATTAIAAVVMSQDAGANASRAAGFFASATE